MQLLVAGGRQGFEWIFLDNRSFLNVVAEDKGEEDQREIQKKLKEHSSVCHIPLRVLEGRPFLAHELSGYLSVLPHDQSLSVLNILLRNPGISCGL